MTYKIGVVGLGVMGANLARNIASRGFPVAGYDLNAAKTQAGISSGRIPTAESIATASFTPIGLMHE